MITKEEAFKEILNYVKPITNIKGAKEFIYFYKDNDCYFQHNLKNNNVYITNKIWTVLKNTYNLDDTSINNFITAEIKKHLRLNNIRILIKDIMPPLNKLSFISKKTKSLLKLKTWEDICEYSGRNPYDLPIIYNCDDNHKRYMLANYKLTIIAEVKNNGWQPNYNDNTQPKWYPYFQWQKGTSSIRSGFVFYYSYSVGGATNTSVGGRLCFPTEAESDSFAKDFIELYNDILQYHNPI